MLARSARADVRNPVLALPAAERLLSLSPESREALREVLLDLQRDARARADRSWDSHKAPMAVYWNSIGVYAGHIARAIGRSA